MKRNLIPLALLVLLLGSSATLAYAQASPGPAIAQATTEINNGNYQLAITKLNAVADLGSRKEKSTVQYWLGIAKYRLGLEQVEMGNQAEANRFFTGANTHFTNGANQNSESGYNYAGLGMILMEQRKVSEARVQFDKAVGLAGSDASLMVAIATAYLRANEIVGITPEQKREALSQARVLLTKAQVLDPNNADILISLGDLYLAQGVMNSAETNYRQAVQKAPSNARAHHFLGRILVRMAEAENDTTKRRDYYAKAFEAMRASKAADARYAPVLLDIAKLYMASGQYAQAKREMEAYRQLLQDSGGDQRYANALYGINLYLIKDYENAVAVLTPVVRDSSSFVLQRIYGYSLIEREKYQEGLAALDKYFTMTASDPSIRIAKDYRYQGMAYFKLNQYDKAIEALNTAIRIHTNPADLEGVYKTLYEVYKAQEKWPQAVQALEQEYARSGSLTDLFWVGYYLSAKVAGTDLALLQRADSMLNVVCQRSPTFVDGFYNRATTQNKIELQDTARRGLAAPAFETMVQLIESTNQAERQASKLKIAYGYLMVHYYRLGNDAKAYELAKKLKAIDPTNPNLTNLMPHLERTQGGSGGR
jgi:tetratricopeptide (TPR) repeat protein